MNTKLFLLILSIGLFANTQTQNISKHSFSVMTGGIVFKNPLVSTNEIGYEWGHFGVITDFT